MEEVWKKHPVYNVEFSTFGAARRLSGRRKMVTYFGSTTISGYLQICIENKSIVIHRLIVETFIGNIPKGKQVNHIDGNKKNNNLNNLEIVTCQENIQHSYKLGMSTIKYGEDTSCAKLTNENIIEIYRLIKDGKTCQEIADHFGLCVQNVSSIKRGKTWGHLKTNFLSENDFSSLRSRGCSTPNETRVNIIKDIKNGMMIERIAEKYNYDPSGLSKIKRKIIWKDVWELVEKQELLNNK